MNVVLRLALVAFLLIVATVSPASAAVDVSDHTVEEHTASYDMSFSYPSIGIPTDDALMRDWAQSLVDDFRASVTRRTTGEPSYFAQLSYDVTRNDDSVLVVLFDYSIYTGGAHGITVQTSFDYLMPDGTRVFLPDLIGGDGIKRVSDIAVDDLTAQLGTYGPPDVSWIRTGAGPYADNFETFEWLPDEVVLHFDPYAVAAYAAGPQQVHIPLSAVQDVLRPDPHAPLASFDCGLAETATEHAICSDQHLAQLDRRVGEAYAARLRYEGLSQQPARVKTQQVNWLAERDAACANTADAALVTCLTGQYAQRLTTLRRFE